MQTKCKTMIVTGAAKGIGAGVTNAFIDRGYNIVANFGPMNSPSSASRDRRRFKATSSTITRPTLPPIRNGKPGCAKINRGCW